MPLYRVRPHYDEHHATLIITAAAPEPAGDVARRFVAAMQLGHYPADHRQRWPEIVRIELAASWFEAEAPFRPVVESIDEIDPANLDRE
jgi:hypothetical protein